MPKGIYPRHEYTWTEEQKTILRNNAGKLTCAQLVPLVGHTRFAVAKKMQGLGIQGLRQGMPAWSAERIEVLLRVGPTMGIHSFIRIHGGSRESARFMARKHGVTFGNMRVPGAWSDADIARMRELAPTRNKHQAAIELGRSYKSLQNKALELGVVFQKHVRSKKARPVKQPRAPRQLKQAAPPRPSAPKIKPRKVEYEVSRIQYCQKCKAPVSNQEKHYERMPQCRPQPTSGAIAVRYTIIPAYGESLSA